jgi:hypothetical protein
VLVDHTPPAPADEFTSEFDPDERTVDIDWTSPEDPALPDGNPGSGLDHEEYRYRRGDGQWTDWALPPDDVRLYDAFEGEHIAVEVRGVDEVGNWSVTVPFEYTLTEPVDDDSDPEDEEATPAEMEDSSFDEKPDFDRDAVIAAPLEDPPEVALLARPTVRRGRGHRHDSAVHAAEAPAVENCPTNRSYKKVTKISRVNFKRTKRGKLDNGHHYVRYQLNFQVRLAWRLNAARSYVKARHFKAKDHVWDTAYNDSNHRIQRGPLQWKPWYAHAAFNATPNTIVAIWGENWIAPVQIGRRWYTGSKIPYRACWARY